MRLFSFDTDGYSLLSLLEISARVIFSLGLDLLLASLFPLVLWLCLCPALPSSDKEFSIILGQATIVNRASSAST